MLNFSLKDFSGTIKARSLKLGMQCSNDDLYRVRDNGLSWLICSFILPSLHIGYVKLFVKDFSRTIKARSLKLGMQFSNDDLYRVRDNGLSWLICSFIFPHSI